MTKKATQNLHRNPNTPPSLCHSVQTSDGYSDILPGSHSHSRSQSIDQSPLTSDNAFQMSPEGYFAMPAAYHLPPPPHMPLFSPYEIDIKTERQIFVNDVPTRKDSTISTFSTFQPPPSVDLPGLPADSWVQQDYFESSRETFGEEGDYDFLDLRQSQMTPTQRAVIAVDESDRPLLDHFLKKVVKLIFPILDANQQGSASSGVVLPALEYNRCYLHCCLSIAGVHKKSTERNLDSEQAEKIEDDIVRHRYETIRELVDALDKDVDHPQILDATLAMIFFQCCVGRPDDATPDIAWHQHFNAAFDLAKKLELPQAVTVIGSPMQTQPPFNMTLTAWIDILGATMLGRSPLFADTYRELNLAHASLGLAELMGCDDDIMFLISEIACLEARKDDGMAEVMLCQYVELLGNQIGRSELAAGTIQSAISATGAIDSRQLCTNMTAIFRIAARIYLCTMVPGYSATSPSIVNLVVACTEAMNFIPAGAEGFDKSLVWPLLIAGSVSTPDSPFRPMFADRCKWLGDLGECGSFGRVRQVLNELWSINDAATASTTISLDPSAMSTGGSESAHWRDVMRQRKWDCLLI